MNPVLSVVVATRHKVNSLRWVLKSLARQTYKNFEIIVANDGGTPASELSCQMGRELDLHVRHIWASPPLTSGVGAASARNQAIRLARTERVLIIDDDCVCPRDLVQAHVCYGQEMVGVIGLRRHVFSRWWPAHLQDAHIENLSLLLPVSDQELRGSDPQRRELESRCQNNDSRVECYAWTCHVSYPTQALKAVGGFWEEMKGCGAEDRELALRLHRHGVKFSFLSLPWVWHLDHPASEEQTQEYPRNRELLSNTQRDASIVIRNGGPLP